MSVTVVDKIVGNLIECAHGDGVSTVFMPDIITLLPTANTTYYRTDWRGTYALSPNPRTNLLTYSEQFDNGAWVKGSLGTPTANATVAPDGTITADQILELATTAIHQVYQTFTATAVPYTFSIYLKPAGGRQWCFVRIDDGATATGVVFDIVNGVIGISVNGAIGTITPAPNGFCRVSVTATLTAGTRYAVVHPVLGNNNATTILGDVTKGFYYWGGDVKEGSGPTSYIPTASSPVTVTDYTINGSGLVTLATALPNGTPLYRNLFNEYGIVL